jgi:hypothetical protein
MKKRRCSACKKLKIIKEFGKLKKSSDGINPRCKICGVKASSESYRKNRPKNKEKHKKSSRKWKRKNKKRIKEYGKIYYQKNKKRILKYQRDYVKANPKKRKRTTRKYYIKNVLKYRHNTRRWRKTNPERARAQRNARHKKVKRATPKWLSKKLFNKVVWFYQNCPKNKTVDHIIPICGKLVMGLNVPWNLQYLTRSKNSSKYRNIDLLEASHWYGKILEKAGLKDRSKI